MEANPAETDRPDSDWWKSAVVYQVYPRSFADSNGDGIGDLRGIIEHLDHIQLLGIDVVWLSPVYRSPQDDNGYDISDYQDVDPVFGTLADLDELVTGIHLRGMRIILDLVVNHTSDEHAWFQDSRTSRTSAHADWYVWRDPRPGTTGGTPGAEPNNWGAFFGGSAWEWEPARGQYYLHLFSKKQPDLNWDNDVVRAAVYGMMTSWLDRGVDGFRMDVINFISKDPGFPDGAVLANGYGDGTPFFSYGPHIHDYLAEMKSTVFDTRPTTVFTVGEMPTVTPEQAARFTDARTGQLNMVFQFEHVDLDHDGVKWNHRPATVLDLKRSFGRWQEALAEHGWNSLYWSNHDQPRVVSRWGNDREYWYESATALATVLHLHRGTPYVYQGEELGMTNGTFATLDEFRDIESLNYYDVATNTLGLAPDDVLTGMRRISRDNARLPVHWDGGAHAGFTTGEPWMPVHSNHTWLNAAAQVGDPNSVYTFYRRLIGLRHSSRIVVDGTFTMLLADHPTVYAFIRESIDGRLLVVANLSDEPASVELDELDGAELLLANHARTPAGRFDPWDARVYRLPRRG
ncbi:alpha-glucosidase [Microbacterium deminutum]